MGKYELLSMHINPSASCTIVLDQNLAIRARLFGFNISQIGPQQFVFIEDMVHFASVHQERLMFVDLGQNKFREVYPLQDDPRRAKFIAEHSKHLPDPKTCEANNDPCDAETFDEGISQIHSTEEGGLVIEVSRDASHATAPGGSPESVASETTTYLYANRAGKWLFCETPIVTDSSANNNFKATAQVSPSQLCIPAAPAIPDMDSADLSPFPKPTLSPTSPK